MNPEQNIFDVLAGKTKAKEKDIKALDSVTVKPGKDVPIASMKTEDMIGEWQKTQNTEYRDELLRRMQPTIKSAMNSYASGMGDRLAVKAAKITLDALRTFDPTKGANPSTFVFHNLHRLSRYAADNSNILKEPESLRSNKAFVQDYIDRFQDIHDREPSLTELADATGLSRKRLDKILNDNSITVSESQTLSEDSQKDTQTNNKLNDNDYFEYVYMSVSPVDQKIMEWSSGIHGKPVLSNGDIAKRLNISQAAVSQRRSKIQEKMSEIRSLA